MKSVCTVETFIPSPGSPSKTSGIAEAVGDVAGRVLVVERVEEREVRLPDPGRAVDERQLAEVGAPLVARELAAHDVGALVGLHVDDLAVLAR